MTSEHQWGSLDRREFLRVTLAGSSYAALAQMLPAELLAARPTREAEVIVIGAGMAGISAAHELAKAGVSVILLEARDRLGGRIWTNRQIPHIAADMGAAWMHKAETSPLLPLAKKFGIKTVLTPFEAISLHQPDGMRLSTAQTLEVAVEYLELIERRNRLSKQRKRQGLPDISMEKALELVLKDWDISPTQKTQLTFFYGALQGELRAAKLTDESLYYTETDKNLGLEDRAFPNGYAQLVEALAEGLDIRIRHVVEAVGYGKRTVNIHTNHGTFTADRAVITLPLGVLQAKRVRFDPLLPKEKRAAINRLHMGTDNKLYLKFPHRFWERSKPTFIAYQKTDPGKFGVFVNPYWAQQNLLMGFAGGDYGVRSEDFTDAKIVRDAMDSLRTAYGNSIPEPEAILRSRWYSDPFSLGSYSHIPPGATPDDYRKLSLPVSGKLYFAGEATISKFRSSVRGAYVTGVREARRILHAMGIS